MTPSVLPHAAQIAGTADCIAQGELLSHAAKPEDLDGGFPVSCYRSPDVPLDPIFHRASSVWRCQTQLFYSRIIDYMYADSIGAAFFELQQFFGLQPRITFHRGTSQFPGVFTIVDSTYCVVIIHGTNNYQQLALQAFQTITGPTNVGIYGTVPLWYNASSYVHNLLLDDGMTAGMPIMIVGHSYGGAVTLNLAARYRYADDTRLIRYLTFGAPKPGDQRLIDLVKLCAGVDLANTEDFVTVLPPDIHLLQPVIAILGLVGLAVWESWKSPPNSTLQYPDGHLEVNVPTLLDTQTLLGFVQRVLLHQTLFGMPAHTIPEYMDRISTRCRNDTMPAAGNLGEADRILSARKTGFRGFDLMLGRIGLSGLPIARGRVRLGVAWAGRLLLHAYEVAFGELDFTSYRIELAAIELNRGIVVPYGNEVFSPSHPQPHYAKLTFNDGKPDYSNTCDTATDLTLSTTTMLFVGHDSIIWWRIPTSSFGLFFVSLSP